MDDRQGEAEQMLIKEAYRRRRRRNRWIQAVSLVAVILVTTLATNGFGHFPSPVPTKGTVPYAPPKGPNYKSIPDYVAVYVSARTTGYTPKAYVEAPNGASNTPLLGRAAPVYASNLTTLLGHEYPGIGFVPKGQSPWTQACHQESSESISADGTVTTSTLPCPSAVLVLPKVVGMVTPTAVGELSGLGVDVVIVNVHSKSVPPGHIVGTSPRGGSKVHGRQPILVYISVR
jgi:hypothetical protein